MREGGYFTYSSTVSLIKKKNFQNKTRPTSTYQIYGEKQKEIRTLVISRKLKQISEVSKHMKSRRE
jgi:hypothetical protein